MIKDVEVCLGKAGSIYLCFSNIQIAGDYLYMVPRFSAWIPIPVKTLPLYLVASVCICDSHHLPIQVF